MKKADIFVVNINSLSVTELEKLEKTLSTQLIKVQNGIIDDSFAEYEPNELKQKLSNKILSVHNLITAKKIRG